MDNISNYLTSLDYWRICDELTVAQAILLILGEDPTGRGEESDGGRAGFQPLKLALVNAIRKKRLPAEIPDSTVDVAFQLDQATVAVDDLRRWLTSRGLKPQFFFPEAKSGPDYLSKDHFNYSPKLAAAICAWMAVSGDPELRRGKSVKQALDVWLRQHANEFGLTKEDGNPNEQGIQEIAKIANWDPKGGAPKTPAVE
jgi:hypothetical protein